MHYADWSINQQSVELFPSHPGLVGVGMGMGMLRIVLVATPAHMLSSARAKTGRFIAPFVMLSRLSVTAEINIVLSFDIYARIHCQPSQAKRFEDLNTVDST
jgi:hypothetical protein